MSTVTTMLGFIFLKEALNEDRKSKVTLVYGVARTICLMYMVFSLLYDSKWNMLYALSIVVFTTIELTLSHSLFAFYIRHAHNPTNYYEPLGVNRKPIRAVWTGP